MEVADLFPPAGHIQHLYCDECGGHLDLAFTQWSEVVSGVDIRVEGLPVLRCPGCKRDHLPDLSRLALIDLHKRAIGNGAPAVTVDRRKRVEDFGFTTVPFIYDADDYYYIPGLYRSHDAGFLTPVFLNREVLLKYDNSPQYRVQFASTTYGTIYMPGDYISFGINRHGKLVMWLGDVAKMPEAEQYYLRSENVDSDHCIGGEFYDGQIECKFTPPTAENALFQARSDFVEACYAKFGTKVAHLDAEVMTLALDFNAPVIDTEKERRHVADTLNKIYLESLDNAALAAVMRSQGDDPAKLGSLKRLQAILTPVAAGVDVSKLLSPFYVLYDLRVAYSHLTTAEASTDILATVTARLSLPAGVDIFAIYQKLVQEMTASFEQLTGSL